VQEYITKQEIMEKVTIPALQQMKRDARKIAGVVAWDFHIAQLADRAGVEIVSVGDSVGVNLWGRTDPEDITTDEMMIVCKAVRRGTARAIVSCDLPAGVLREGIDSAVRAALRLAKEGGADMVKLDGAAELPEGVTAIAKAGVPVFAQFEAADDQATETLVSAAKRLEAAGASMLDFKYSGPVAGAAVVSAVSIPVIGGMGGGPWLDGRIRMAHAAIGYAASSVESKADNYANVARTTLEALKEYATDVRAGRQIKSGKPV
jgi:3-methyl-2-oxobutanoate hydroxymethyltransferase